MYSSISRMKCTHCGKGEIVTPNPNQTIDDYLNTKKCSSCRKIGTWEIIPAGEKKNKKMR